DPHALPGVAFSRLARPEDHKEHGAERRTGGYSIEDVAFRGTNTRLDAHSSQHPKRKASAKVDGKNWAAKSTIMHVEAHGDDQQEGGCGHDEIDTRQVAKDKRNDCCSGC